MFALLPDDRRQRLAESGALVSVEAHAFLFLAGDEADALYAVLSGAMEVTTPARDGREVWLARLGPGALVGEMGVLDGGRRSASVTAERRSELWRIGRAVVIDTLREEPSAALELLALLSRRLRSADRRLQEASLLDLGGRLARLLLDEEGAAIIRSQADMARLIGASRERVNRKLADWRSQGLLEIGPFGVKVLDPASLAASAQPLPLV